MFNSLRLSIDERSRTTRANVEEVKDVSVLITRPV
jgi:hypothetical protein